MGAGNSWAEGYSFGSGLVEGLKYGGVGAWSSGVAGGLLGGMDALDKGTSFWTGKAKFDLNGAFSYVYNRYVIYSCTETLLTHG